VQHTSQVALSKEGKRNGWAFAADHKFVPLAELKDLTFGGWDIFKDTLTICRECGRAESPGLEKVKPFLSTIKPMKAAFDQDFVKLIDGPNVKKARISTNWLCKSRKTSPTFRKTSVFRAGHLLVWLDGIVRQA